MSFLLIEGEILKTKTKKDLALYVWDKYEGVISDAVHQELTALYRNSGEFQDKENSIPEFDLSVDRLNFEVEYLSSERIRIYILVSAHYACYEVTSDSDGGVSWDIYDADKYKNFLVEFDGDISNEFQVLTLAGIQETALEEGELRTSFDSSHLFYDFQLLPAIKNWNFDFASRKLLNEFYNSNPIGVHSGPIEPNILAANMGLTVKRKLTLRNTDIDGAIFFNDDIFDYSQIDSGKNQREHVQKGTVILITGFDDNNRKNNTLVHECVHWCFHRPAFYLQKLLGNNVPKITCRNGIEGKENGDYFSIREWQANKLSPRILCPSEGLLELVEADYEKRREEFPEECVLDSAAYVIKECASYYNVSIQLFTNLLRDLGVKKLGGFFKCPGDFYGKGRRSYIAPYLVREGQLRWGETYDLPNFDYEFLLENNPELKEAVDLGMIVFVDNHVCLVKPNLYDERFPHSLSNYARLHMDEFCFIFKEPINETNYKSSSLNSPNRAFTVEKEQEIQSDLACNPANREKMKSIRLFLDDMREVKGKLVGDISKDLNTLFGWTGLTQEKVAAGAQISLTAFKNILKGKTKKPSISTIIRLCFGLQLPYRLSISFLNSAGYVLSNSEEDTAYDFILSHFTYGSLDNANEYLEFMGLNPLKSPQT